MLLGAPDVHDSVLKLNNYYSLLDKKKFLFLILFNVNKPYSFIQSFRIKPCRIANHCLPSWFSNMLSMAKIK